MNAGNSRLMRQLTANKKQMWILIALVAVGLLLWGRVLLKQVPRTAIASPQAEMVAVVHPAPQPAPETLRTARQVIYADLAADPGRNLFAWDTRRYARPNNWTPPTSGPEKSAPEPTDDMRVPEMVARARATLKLQTTVLGERPRAMINGQLLHVGQEIQGFVLRQVFQRKVVLEMIKNPNHTWATDGPVLVELEM